MSIGQILGDTFAMVKGRFGSLLALWAIYFAITIGLSMILVVGFGAVGLAGLATMGDGDALSTGGVLAAGGGMILFVVLFYLGYLLLVMAQYASLIAMASPLRQLTVGDALGTGWRAAPALLLLLVVLMIGYLVLAVPVGLLGTAFSSMGESAGGLLLLLLVPVLVWLGCRLAPLYAVVAVDGVRNPFTAISRAWHLTRGHALTIFLASLVFMIVLIALCGIALLPSIGMLRSMADPTALTEAAAAPALGGMALFFLGLLVVGVLFNLCYCAFLSVIHATLSGARGEGAAEAFA
jgi:hypothetical protein